MKDATQSLVDEYAGLYPQLKAMELRSAEIKTALIEKGPAEYVSADGHVVTVIFPAPRIAPKPDQIAQIEKAIGKPAFGQLFDRVIVWKPAKSCRDVAQRILKGATLKKFFDLAETDSPAQVRIS